MPRLQIDSLVLQVPGGSPADGQRLALEVTRRLGEDCACHAPREIPALRLELTAGSRSGGVAEMGRQIVAQILREIHRQS